MFLCLSPIIPCTNLTSSKETRRLSLEGLTLTTTLFSPSLLALQLVSCISSTLWLVPIYIACTLHFAYHTTCNKITIGSDSRSVFFSTFLHVLTCKACHIYNVGMHKFCVHFLPEYYYSTANGTTYSMYLLMSL